MIDWWRTDFNLERGKARGRTPEVGGPKPDPPPPRLRRTGRGILRAAVSRRHRAGSLHFVKSAGGLAHSRTLRAFRYPGPRDSVLECGGPPPLSTTLNANGSGWHTPLARAGIGWHSLKQSGLRGRTNDDLHDERRKIEYSKRGDVRAFRIDRWLCLLSVSLPSFIPHGLSHGCQMRKEEDETKYYISYL